MEISDRKRPPSSPPSFYTFLIHCFTIPRNFPRRFIDKTFPYRPTPRADLVQKRKTLFCTAYIMRTTRKELVAHGACIVLIGRSLCSSILLSMMRMDFTAANKWGCGLVGLTMYNNWFLNPLVALLIRRVYVFHLLWSHSPCFRSYVTSLKNVVIFRD